MQQCYAQQPIRLEIFQSPQPPYPSGVFYREREYTAESNGYTLAQFCESPVFNKYYC